MTKKLTKREKEILVVLQEHKRQICELRFQTCKIDQVKALRLRASIEAEEKHTEELIKYILRGRRTRKKVEPRHHHLRM